MEPTKKAPGINAFLSSIAGKDRESTIRSDKCMFCDTPNVNFRDELSKREYSISGLCQDCQDKTFGGEDEDGLEAEQEEDGDIPGTGDWDPDDDLHRRR